MEAISGRVKDPAGELIHSKNKWGQIQKRWKKHHWRSKHWQSCWPSIWIWKQYPAGPKPCRGGNPSKNKWGTNPGNKKETPNEEQETPLKRQRSKGRMWAMENRRGGCGRWKKKQSVGLPRTGGDRGEEDNRECVPSYYIRNRWRVRELDAMPKWQ